MMIQARSHDDMAEVVRKKKKKLPLLGRTLEQFGGIGTQKEPGAGRERAYRLYHTGMPLNTSPGQTGQCSKKEVSGLLVARHGTSRFPPGSP